MKRETWPLGRPDSDEYHQHWLRASELAVQFGSPSLTNDIMRLMARGMTVDEIRHTMTARKSR